MTKETEAGDSVVMRAVGDLAPGEKFHVQVTRSPTYTYVSADVATAGSQAVGLELSFLTIRKRNQGYGFEVVQIEEGKEASMLRGLSTVGGIEVVEEVTIRLSREVALSTAIMLLKHLQEHGTSTTEIKSALVDGGLIDGTR